MNSEAEREALALLAEECGELVQAIGKALRHGIYRGNPEVEGHVNLHDIEQEIGDVLASMLVLEENGVTRTSTVVRARDRKLEKLPNYLHHARCPEVP